MLVSNNYVLLLVTVIRPFPHPHHIARFQETRIAIAIIHESLYLSYNPGLPYEKKRVWTINQMGKITDIRWQEKILYVHATA